MTKRKIPEHITEKEFIQIIKKVYKLHHKLAFLLGFYACMRVSEVVKLQPENVDKGQRLIRIKDAKGGKDRNIPLPREVVRGLSNLPIKCGERALQIAIKRYGKKVLNKDIHFHTLRHSGATYYLNHPDPNKKLDVRQVQVLLGHSRITTTEIYTHVTPTTLVKKFWGEEGVE